MQVEARIVAMKYVGTQELIVLFVVVLVLFGPKSLKELAADLGNAMNNFRGGPGSPSHPVPADDSRLLNRKSRGAKEESDRSSPH